MASADYSKGADSGPSLTPRQLSKRFQVRFLFPPFSRNYLGLRSELTQVGRQAFSTLKGKNVQQPWLVTCVLSSRVCRIQAKVTKVSWSPSTAGDRVCGESPEELPETQTFHTKVLCLPETSLVVLWLKNLPCNAGYMSSIPDQGTKIPHAMEPTTTRESKSLDKRSHMMQLRPNAVTWTNIKKKKKKRFSIFLPTPRLTEPWSPSRHETKSPHPGPSTKPCIGTEPGSPALQASLVTRSVKNQAAMWETWGPKELDTTKQLSLSFLHCRWILTS